MCERYGVVALCFLEDEAVDGLARFWSGGVWVISFLIILSLVFFFFRQSFSAFFLISV
jgi:hypothetical protein